MKKVLKKLLATVVPAALHSAIVVNYWKFRNTVPSSYEKEVKLLSLFVTEGDYVVDLGVNMGQYTVPLSRLVGSSGRVLGFEALPSTFELARRIVEKRKNVKLHNIAVSDRRGTCVMKLHFESDGSLNRGLTSIIDQETMPSGGETIEVDCIPLDEVLADRNQRIRFIKCDVEGHEFSVIKGAMDIIRQDHPAIMLEARPASFNKIVNALRDVGYVPTKVTDTGVLERVTECVSSTENFFFVSGQDMPDFAGNDVSVHHHV